MKNKLLEFGVFVDNSYLDSYVNLLNKNLCTKQIKFVTQKHHIIPKCCYNFKNIPIDNSTSNCINLQYKDHVLAHYYLCLCISSDYPRLRYGLINAFLHLVQADANNKIKIEQYNISDFDKYQDLYTEWKWLNSSTQKGHPSWNKGLTKENDERVRKCSKPRHFSKEHNENLRQSMIRYYSTHRSPNFNKPLSQETKEKISKAHKGKPRTWKNPDCVKKKLSIKTKKYWEEHPEKRQKLIEYNKTRKLSEDTLEKKSLSCPHRIPIAQVSADGTVLCVFSSVRKAIQVTGIKRYKIVHSCQSGKLLKEGFSFKYLDKDYEQGN